MSEMTEAIRATILRNFTARAAELADQRPTDRHPWSWEEGIALFPEARCPYCSAAIQSNRIWKIGPRQVFAQWRLDRGRLVKEQPEHPHCGGGGAVCTGNADSTLAALFFSINTGDTYWGRGPTAVKPWLAKMFGHICHQPDVVIPYCEECGGELPIAIPGRRAPVAHDCRNTPCTCGCGCRPAYGPCNCGHPECRCPAVSTEVLENGCSHPCCSDCCRQNGCNASWGNGRPARF